MDILIWNAPFIITAVLSIITFVAMLFMVSSSKAYAYVFAALCVLFSCAAISIQQSNYEKTVGNVGFADF